MGKYFLNVEYNNQEQQLLEHEPTNLNETSILMGFTENQNENSSLIGNFKSTINSYLNRYEYFNKSPKVRFIQHTLFFTGFLLIFSYMLLCDFNYYKIEQRLSNSNETDNSTNENNNSSEISQDRLPNFRSVNSNKIVNYPKLIEYM